jgi:hypothetical protein
MALGVPPAPAERPPVSPQVVGDSGSLRGRCWADVADEVDAEEAALAELAARCSPPSKPSLADFIAVVRRDLRQRGRGRCGGAVRSPVRASASPLVRGSKSASGWCGPRVGASSVLARDGVAVLGRDLALERCSEVLVPPILAIAAAVPGTLPPPSSTSSAPEQGDSLGTFVGPAGLASVRRPIIPWRSQDARSRVGPSVTLWPVGGWLWLQKGSSSLDLGFPAPALMFVATLRPPAESASARRCRRFAGASPMP